MTRKETLERAAECVTGQREEDYGSPEDSFETIAGFWRGYLEAAGNGTAIDGHDVAMMMALLKAARIAHGGTPDSYVDLAGYAACASELLRWKPEPKA